MDILNSIRELFENLELFAELCSKVDLSKEVNIINNYNEFSVQGYMFEWFEIDTINNMNIQEIVAILFVRSLYFTEEWDLNTRISYKDFFGTIYSNLSK